MLRRRLMLSGGDCFVDLGLPSGTLWANGNICKDTHGKYYIGKETDYGCYFTWGNIVGYNEGDTMPSYKSTPGSSLNGDIASNDATHDAALARLGSPWRLPTVEDTIELKSNTDMEIITINGVTGMKYMKKTDHSVYIFIPFAGMRYNTSFYYQGLNGECWLSLYYDDSLAYTFNINLLNITSRSSRSRYMGLTVRAVQ